LEFFIKVSNEELRVMNSELKKNNEIKSKELLQIHKTKVAMEEATELTQLKKILIRK
jgi:hypothetical protein